MRRVTVEAPTRSRMDEKLGTDSAMKRRKITDSERKTHRFQLKSETWLKFLDCYFWMQMT